MEELRTSVRSMVEFLLRTGNLDNRRHTSSEEAMADGNRIHKMLQKKGGAGYRAEVPLSCSVFVEEKEYKIILEGRADGIMDSYVPAKLGVDCEVLPLFAAEFGMEDPQRPMFYIDEIKGTYQHTERIKVAKELHVAQAKCYAYMLAIEEDLEEVGIRITYCNMETETVKYFHENFTKAEITDWFMQTIASYRKWTDYMFDSKRRKLASIWELSFPFEYRDGQKDLVKYVYQSIYHKKKLFLEAPTGVGKTISTVFPAVQAIGRNMGEKIFYVTAKTITRTVATDTFRLLQAHGLKAKDIVITAKEKTCLNEECTCNPVACPYALGHFERVNDCLYELITTREFFGREQIEQLAMKHKVCPYELSLDASLFADAIVCDYNYVFDPHVYFRRYFAEGSKGKHLFLVDEAHNLLERGKEMYSATLVKEHVLAMKSLAKEHSKKLARAFERVNIKMLEMKKECEGLVVLTSIEPLALEADRLATAIDNFLDNHEESPIREEILQFYFELSHFLLIYDMLDEHYIIYSQLLDHGDFVVRLMNVDPSGPLSQCMEHARSTILFSATLLPIQYYKGLLGGDAEDYEVYAHSIFDTKKRGLFVATDVSSKYTRRNDAEFEKMVHYIRKTVEAKAGNYMIFCPSYAYMERLYDMFDQLLGETSELRGYHILIQGEQMSELEREQFLASFECDGEDETLLAFCVLGGIFSEGIDLKGNRLIGTVIIGTGLPQIGTQRELLKQYFDYEGLNGFDYAYRYPGMNKVLQAAGRVIRTTEDYGVVLLLDDRYTQSAYRQLYPKEWDYIQQVQISNIGEKLESFWGAQNLISE
ncbi:MAG: ATP-dependent DNA helicase [Lachnospiraceae bacterium]